MEEGATVPKETSYPTIIPLLKQFQAVLVHEKGKMVGIITNTDLIGHKKKSGK
jgi:predicted transcriptional regulator